MARRVSALGPEWSHDLAEEVVVSVAELCGVNSPDGQPETMLVTEEELYVTVKRCAEELLARTEGAA